MLLEKSEKVFHLNRFLFFLLRLLLRLALKRIWVVRIDILEAFEYQYGQLAVFNLNF